MYGDNLTMGNNDGVKNVVSLTNLTTLSMSRVLAIVLFSFVNLTSLSHLYLYDSDITSQPFCIWISNPTSLVTLKF